MNASKVPASNLETPQKQPGASFFGPSPGAGSFFAPTIQTKLTVNEPGDAYEQEADAVADQVMRMREGDVPVVQRMPLTAVSGVQRACAHCEEEERKAQRKTSGGGDAGGKTAPASVNEVISSGGGQAMDGGTRQFMESRFGQDFSGVRIHTDSRAAESAAAIQARAYTSGRDVVFGAGEYQPASEGGKRLLAHELVHVGQQSNKVKSAVLQRACGEDFASYRGATCQGVIQVGATTISSPIIGYYHLFILYTDSTGKRIYLRGRPNPSPDNQYGNIIVQCGEYLQGTPDYDERNIFEKVYEYTDACTKLRTMQTMLNRIESLNIPYSPQGPNSNSVIATLLRAASLPLLKPSVPTPGFEMEITAQRTTNSVQHLSPVQNRIALGIGGGNHLQLSAEFQRLLTTLRPSSGGLPLPFPVLLDTALHYSPEQRRASGSVGLGTEFSVFNIPWPVHSPLSVGAGTGVTVGGSETRSTESGRSQINPEVGLYVRAGLNLDVNRFRISPMWQYNGQYNTGSQNWTDSHQFLLNLGYTFY